MSEEKYKVTKQYGGKKNSDIINFPVDFRREYLTLQDPTVLELPIIAFRIMFKILNEISRDQYNPKNKEQSRQLQLFEDYFMTEDNLFSSFVFKVSDIDKNRDYKLIQHALDKLELFKREWYTSVNIKGKKIKSLGGLISRPKISDGEITFEVSSYWMRKLSEIPSYNVALLQTAWKLKNNKHALFYMWILEVPTTGTRVEFEKFQKMLGFNYSNIQDFVKQGLKPIKKNLDLYSNKSFNYSVKDGFINIVPYFVKNIQEVQVSDITRSKQSITQRIHYWKTRHKLNEHLFTKLKELTTKDPSSIKILEDSYLEFINYCKQEEKKATDFIGETFIEMFQKHITITYHKTIIGQQFPGAYPKI